MQKIMERVEQAFTASFWPTVLELVKVALRAGNGGVRITVTGWVDGPGPADARFDARFDFKVENGSVKFDTTAPLPKFGPGALDGLDDGPAGV